MTKIAVLSQSGPCIAALTTLVTHACPFPMWSGGCSPLFVVGMTHDTFGSVPSAAASK